MLNHLQIRDFAIVGALELEFGRGMSAITGETGAGKSIMLDALGLLLGDRADSSAVRVGAERAEIAASFDLSDQPAARDWLAERDLENGDDDCHLRRLISTQGRSRAYINGVSQPLSSLKALGELLVDIHGQHQSQSLLKRDLQRQLLDDYAGHQSLLKPEQRRRLLDAYGGHQGLLGELGDCYQRWRQLQRRLDQLRDRGDEFRARRELLEFQVQELDQFGLAAGELAQLEQEHKRLANAEELLSSSQLALADLYERESPSPSQSQSAYGLLSRWAGEFASLSNADRRLSEVAELLNSAQIQIEEASNSLRGYLQQMELDPQRLVEVEQRLSDSYALARKHKVEPAELVEHLARLSAELAELSHGGQSIDVIEKQLAAALTDYRRCAKQLTAQRRAAAKQLSRQVSEVIAELGMPDGHFGVELPELSQPAEFGLENVEFLVSANPDQPMRPLSKVASGGELSRISLAINVIAADSARIPTLIFDEVDTGIGGAVAEVVGRRLRELGRNRQVLCVTHLPQVAAQAHQQFQVSKKVHNGTTATEVIDLKTRQRVEELARMLGGVKLTKNTLAHAREMIERAQD